MVKSCQQAGRRRYPTRLYDYRRIGKKRRHGRPLKEVLDGHDHEAETGHLLA